MKIKPGCTVQEHNPELIPLWSSKNTLKPDEISYGSNKTIYLICKKHGEYSTTCKAASRSKRCLTCAHRGKPPYEESLGFLYPELVSQWSASNTLTPFEVWPSSHFKATWICPIHGEYKQTYANRSMGKGCKKCGYIRTREYNSISSKNNSFANLYPHLLKEYSKENNRNPYSLKPQANYLASWLCSICGYKWKTFLYNRTNKGSGCPKCCNNQTSKSEKLLRKALIPFGVLPDPHRISNWEVDIYLPDSQTIIEYDGSYYHSFSNSFQTDTRKSLDLLSKGYKVIRIRTYSKSYQLPSLNISHSSYHEISIPEPLDSQPTPDLLDKLTSLL